MDVQHIGHAGFIVGWRGFRLGIDPWFYPAFLESWFPWPDNRRFLEDALDVDAVYISHAHEDHFDRRFLRQLTTDVTVVIPAFRSRYLEREVRKLGFTDIRVLGHKESLDLGSKRCGALKVTALLDQSHKEDSAVLVERPGFRFLDSNDCELAIGDWPQADLLACAFSGAFWYPHCYDFARDVTAAKAAEVRENNLQRLFRRIAHTNATMYAPSAGPAVFLDDALMRFNDFQGTGIYPTFGRVAARVRGTFPKLVTWPTLWEPLYANAFTQYQADRALEWQAFYDRDDTPATTDEVDAHFTHLQRRNRRFLEGYRRNIRVSSDGRNWRVLLGLLRGELEEAPEPHYVLDMPPRVLRAILNGDATWETALLSNRIRLHAAPDGYDATLMGLLGFGDRPVQTLAMARQQESGETITREGFTFQRWCPHAREDLTFATVSGSVIECPRHNWRWDAITGKCLSGGGIPLRTEKAVP